MPSCPTHFDHDDWDLVAADSDGYQDEHVAWDAFVDWITGADLSVQRRSMSRLIQQLDIENFTSFIILHLWAGNTDWGRQQLVCGPGCVMIPILGGDCSCGMLTMTLGHGTGKRWPSEDVFF